MTGQRFLDCWSVFRGFADRDRAGLGPMLLLGGLIATTVLMAVTMQRHWSAFHRGRPHGCFIGSLMACLQIAPLWEMLDKVFAGNRPREKLDYGSSAARQPLLQYESSHTRDSASSTAAPRSDLPKGSPGENTMRGVRKMSMVNLPQAMLSLWVHARQLAPVGAGVSNSPPQTHWLLAFAFAAAFLCVAFGIADFVLYIWVHDAFVRENKKLVTVHYCVEILCRVPVVVLFHVSYSRQFNYWPTLFLFVVDVLLTSMLLLIPRISKPDSWWDACSCFRFRGYTKQGLIQFLYSLVVSLQLFVVNIVFFDPGMIFFYVNQTFYIIKYMELAVMLHCIRRVKTAGILVLSPVSVFNAFWWSTLVFAALNAFLVYIYVPLRRAEKDARVVNSASPGSSGHDEEVLSLGSPRTLAGDDGGRMLERLEEIFEMLRLLSSSSCGRNRSRLLGVIISELWQQALRWDGEYEDSKGNKIFISVNRPLCAVAKVRIGGGGWARNKEVQAMVILEGAKITLPGGGGGLGSSLQGLSDGSRIRWDDGVVWTRFGDEGGAVASQARAVLRLILPQLALALRWDLPGAASHSGEGYCVPHRLESLESLELGLGPDVLVSPHYEGSGGSRPLLSFLFRYAVMTRQADFITDLYWALYCLSYEESSHGQRNHAARAGKLDAARAYRAARLTLLRLLRGEAAGGEMSPGPGPHVEADRSANAFLEEARQQLRGQRELWQQKMDLLVSLGHIGSPNCASCPGVSRTSGTGTGAWAHRTEDFREALRRWPDLRRRFKVAPRSDEDALLLQVGPSTEEGGTSSSSSLPLQFSDITAGPADLVHPDSTGSCVSLPIDPTVAFRGIVIEECQVVPSKHAPLLFSCLTSSTSSSSIDAGLSKEKYLLKSGDDLRQDQLMLQMMALMGCVWQERLSPADVKLLQLAKFRVLAVTPHSGYVKFVPDAVALTDALHQSQGNLVTWLDRNRPPEVSLEKVLDTLCGSVAASCVVTYILGIGDRHLENLCITRRGQFFHIDFSFVLGDDPKPCAPQVRLPQQVAQALLATDRLNLCFGLAARAYLALRPFAGLWGSILQLTAAAGGAGCTKLAREPLAAVAGVRERLRVEQQDEELAASEFLCLVRESSEGLASILMDKVHAAGLFWR